MASITPYLDTRRPKADGSYPIRIGVHADKKSRFISTGLSVTSDEWDEETNSVNSLHPLQKKINLVLAKMVHMAESVVLDFMTQGKEPTLDELTEAVRVALGKQKPEAKESVNKDSFGYRFKSFAASRPKESTRKVYQHTINRLNALVPNWENLAFEEINSEWLRNFDIKLAESSPSPNARNIHFRNIRAVFNDAIDDEITRNYPFRKFKLKYIETEKRSLSVEQLRQLWNYPCEDWQRPYVDIFKLMFMLCGINLIDLFNLEGLVDGRVVYNRSKTGRLYSIKAEPEAMEIIERYKGKKWLVNLQDRYKNHKDYMQHINEALQSIGEWHRLPGRGGKKEVRPLFPDLTTYWSRHTWATIAADIDIPDAVISQALGHRPENATTEIYIRRNPKKVDDANRRVLDYVIYGKK